jgi:hypothetical protein
MQGMSKLSLCASVLVLVTWGRSMPLVAAELRAELAELFALGLKNTAPEVAAAKSQYARIKTARPRDARIDYAYALVLLNQRRYADAVPLLEKYTSAKPDDRQAARVHLWALLQARRYAAALAGAVDFASTLPRQTARQQAPDGDDLRYLGNLFGYLDAVRPPTLDVNDKAERTNELLALLGDARLPTFDEGRREVAERFAAMKHEIQAAVERRAHESQEQRRALAGDFTDTQAEIARGADAMDESRQQLRDVGRSASVLQHELSSLLQERARLGSQIVFVQAQISALQALRHKTAIDPSFNDPNRGQSDAFFFDATGKRVKMVPGEEFTDLTGRTFRVLPGEYYSTTSTRLRTEDRLQGSLLGQQLAALNMHAVSMDKRILGLQAELQNAVGRGQMSSNSLAESQADVRQAERRAAALEMQLRRLEAQGSKPVSSAVASAEMKRLSTYLPLPYDAEAKRVLAWFPELR